MNWVKILSEAELPEGTRQVVQMQDHSILLIHENGAIYAMVSACPHMGQLLKGAKIEGTTITCPRHHSAFDLRTGDVQAWSPWPPAVGKMLGALRRERALTVYETKVEEGAIWVHVPDEGRPTSRVGDE